MNIRMVGILVRKDLRLVLLPVLVYFVIGLAAIGMMAVESKAAFYGGSVLLITALIALGFHPPVATVIGERKDKTLAFVMSMPLTPRDYTWGKLAASLIVFFVPWAVLLLVVIAVIAGYPGMPDGLIPYSSILFGAIATSALLILAVSIVTESLQWAIVTQVVCNLAFQGVMYGASNMDSVKSTINGDAIVWAQPVLLVLGLEAALCGLMLVATLWLQSHKTDFI